MLSRKGSCAGMMSAAAAVDRGRVGERLHAALAGLQELHLLKDRQSDMVSWALRMDREEPVTSVHAAPEGPRAMGAEEQRLEATLTALKQQLVGSHFTENHNRENKTPLLLYFAFISTGFKFTVTLPLTKIARLNVAIS